MCSVVTAARQCLLEQTYNCDDDVAGKFHKKLKLRLSFYSSLTSHCVDIYTCLVDFSKLGRQILSKKDAPEPSSSSSESSEDEEADMDDSSKYGDSKESDGGSKYGKGKGSGGRSKNSKGSGSKSEESESSGGKSGKSFRENDSNLFSLCERIRRKWDCTQEGLETLSLQQRNLLMAMFRPLWTIVSRRCSETGT